MASMKFDEYFRAQGAKVDEQAEQARGKNWDIKYIQCAEKDKLVLPGNCKILAAYWGPKNLSKGRLCTRDAVKYYRQKGKTVFKATSQWWGGSMFEFSDRFLMLKVGIPKEREIGESDNNPSLRITLGYEQYNYSVQDFQDGCKQFEDRPYVVRDVPEALKGLTHFRGPCNACDAVQIEFTAQAPTRFYCIYSMGNNKEYKGAIDALTMWLSSNNWKISSINASAMKTYSFKKKSGWPFGFKVWEKDCRQGGKMMFQLSKKMEFTLLAKMGRRKANATAAPVVAAPAAGYDARVAPAPAPAPAPVVAPVAAPVPAYPRPAPVPAYPRPAPAPAPAVYPRPVPAPVAPTYPAYPRPVVAPVYPRPVVAPVYPTYPTPVVAPVYPSVVPVPVIAPAPVVVTPGIGRTLYQNAMVTQPAVGLPGTYPAVYPGAVYPRPY